MSDTDIDASRELRRTPPLWLRIGGAVLLGYLLATLGAGVFLADQLDRMVDADRRLRLDDPGPYRHQALRQGIDASRELTTQ